MLLPMSKFAMLQPLFTSILAVCLVLWSTFHRVLGLEAASSSERFGIGLRSAKGRLLRRRDDTIPKSPPWVAPSVISPPPACMAPADDCPWDDYKIQQCSDEKCTLTFIGACMQWGTLVDESCLCTSLSDSNCKISCSGGIKRTMYLRWLNRTCSLLDDWNGLSNDWTSEVGKVDVVLVGNRLLNYYDGTYNNFYFAEYQAPLVVNTSCPSYWTDRWGSSIFNATEVSMADPSYPVTHSSGVAIYLDKPGFCTSSYDQLPSGCNDGIQRTELLLWLNGTCQGTPAIGWPQNWADSLLVMNSSYRLKDSFSWPKSPGAMVCPGKLNDIKGNCTSTRCVLGPLGNCISTPTVVDPACFCKEMALDTVCKPTGIERTQLLLWINQTCTGVSGFPGMPIGWKDSLVLMNSTFRYQSNFTWPSCLSPTDCFRNLNGTVTNCSSIRCSFDGVNNCTSTPTAVELPCFCKPVSFGKTCNNNCKLSWERRDYLEWMNSTCTPVRGWDGLPSNWTALLAVQESDLLPWSWQIRAVNNSQNGTNTQARPQHCPSTAAKLGAFAAVNIAIAILVPVLGRRDVMKKLSFGTFGQRGSRAWLLTGPITIGLHVASNAIGAYLIKSSKGYESVDIGQLVLLWCTRPRLAWMVVALIPWQAKDSIYFSVAASTLLAEIVLQVLGSVYMGISSNYARKQKFYNAGRLTNTPHGRDALVMYAGSLLWLTAIIFAIVACSWSILGVNRHIAALGQAIRGSRGRAERHSILATEQSDSFQASLSREEDRLGAQPHVSQELDLSEQLLAREYPRPKQMWTKLSANWEVLRKYLNEDSEKLKTARKAWKDQSKQLRKASRNGPPPAELLQEHNRATETYDDLKAAWRSLPTVQLLEVTEEHLSSAGSKGAVTESMNALAERVSAAVADRTGRQRQLGNINATIEEITRLLRKHIQSGYPVSEKDFLQRQIIKTNLQIQRLRVGNAARTAKLLRLQEMAERCGSGINLDRQRQNLIADRGSVDENGAGSGLLLDLHRDQLTVAQLQSILNGWRDLVAQWTAIVKEWVKLDSEWTNARTRREKEAAEEATDQTRKLRSIAIKTIAGMFSCWVAQWVWWVGYIRVAADSYCPPRLRDIATVWVVFAIFGAILGASL